MIKNKKILITGHAGFVGQHFVNKLNDYNDLFLVDINGDCPIEARNFFREDTTKFDLAIHLAAIVGGRATIEGNPLSVAIDLSIDSEFFQWALRTKQNRLVYYSSSAAYPINLQEKYNHRELKESDINFDEIKSPDLTYGWSKLTGEYQAKFVNELGIPCHVLRPFSGYGETQSLDYPFPSFINRIVNKENPFNIWGDGNQIRDFIHIDDVINATLEVVQQDYKEPLNLGTGIATSFNDLAKKCFEISNFYPQIQHLDAKPVGVQYRVADISNMNKIYKYKISLEEGIERAIKYRRSL